MDWEQVYGQGMHMNYTKYQELFMLVEFGWIAITYIQLMRYSYIIVVVVIVVVVIVVVIVVLLVEVAI